jgi:hypothetical protein
VQLPHRSATRRRCGGERSRNGRAGAQVARGSPRRCRSGRNAAKWRRESVRWTRGRLTDVAETRMVG